MTLETMTPNPDWDPATNAGVIETFAAVDEALVVRVWGGDWCKDCRRQLPDFSAALAAAGISRDQINTYPTEKRNDGTKVGPLVDEYDIRLIPTVVVELDGTEVARFVESESVPIAVYLAEKLQALEITK